MKRTALAVALVLASVLGAYAQDFDEEYEGPHGRRGYIPSGRTYAPDRYDRGGRVYRPIPRGPAPTAVPWWRCSDRMRYYGRCR